MNAIITAFASNRVFANILMVTILMAGLLTAMIMKREDMPSFEVDRIQISIAYPGADPAEIEEGITLKVEEAIDGLQGIDEYSSTSSEGKSVTTVNVVEGYDADRLLDRIRNEVDSITTFPADAESPSMVRPEHQEAVLGLALVSNMSEVRVKEWGDTIKKEITQLPGVNQVQLSGTRGYEIAVEVSQANLLKYNLTIQDVADAISNANLNQAGGTLKTQGQEIRLRTLGRKYTGVELENIKLIHNDQGQTLKLKDVAVIRDGFTETPLSVKANGSAAVLINVMSGESDAINVADAVTRYQEELNATLPPGSRLIILSDDTLSIRANLNMLVSNAVMGLGLVFLLLWLFMDPKISFWAGMGIPISLLGGLAVVHFSGVTLNKVTLFGLIMVLGIVADDAIVVGESIFHHRKQGAGPMEAVVKGLTEVAMPVIAAVLTTMVAFMPLFHINGMMGKFIKAMPTAVMGCLVVSLIECLIMLPAHLSDLSPKEEKPKNRLFAAVDRFHAASVRSMDTASRKLYLPALEFCIRFRYLVLSASIALLLICSGLVTGGIVKFDVFPPQATNIMVATVTFPEGTPFTTTQDAVVRLEQGARDAAHLLSPDREIIVNHLVTVGQAAGQTEGGQTEAQAHIGGMRITLASPSETGIGTDTFLLAWERATGPISGVQSLDFASEGGGPPGAPVEIGVRGENMDHIQAAVDEIQTALNAMDGVSQVYTDNADGKNEYRFSLKPEAEYLGITLADLAQQIHQAYYGATALKVQRGNDEVEINVRLTAEERRDKQSIFDFKLTTADGSRIPLTAVAEVDYGPGYSSINRKNGYRQVTVSAKVDVTRIVSSEVVSRLRSQDIPRLQARYPDLRIVTEGDAKRSAESFGSLYIWGPISVMGMFVIIATMFRSYVQPLLILMTIPFGLVGAVLGHFLMGHMLSLLSIFGMVALAGVVVNDAIVLIERINMNLEEGMAFFPALYQGCQRRFRAVMLTSLSTIGGLIPLLTETDQYAQQLMPMAISLAFGVAFATLLTLLLLPCLFTMTSDLRQGISRLRGGDAQSRHTLEPAHARTQINPRNSHAKKSLPSSAGH